MAPPLVIFENPQRFFTSWWGLHGDAWVKSEPLVELALLDTTFEGRHGKENIRRQKALMGALLYNLARGGHSRWGFVVRRDGEGAGYCLASTEPSPQKKADPDLAPDPDRPFGWVPHPDEQKVLTRMRQMASLGCSLQAITKVMNADGPRFRGSRWTEHEVARTLALTGDIEEFVFHSSGKGPKVSAQEEGVFYAYLETKRWGRLVLRHRFERRSTKLACEKDAWVWREVYRDGRVSGLEVGAAVQLWLCSCFLVINETPPLEIAGVLDGFSRRAMRLARSSEAQ